MINKKLTLIASLILLSLTSCGSFETPSTFDPWDKLGGGKEATVGTLIDLDEEAYQPSFSNSDDLLNTDEVGSTIVNLSNLTTSQYTITKAGKYSFNGNFNGSIVVESCGDGNVQLFLNGVTITPSSTSSLPAILFKKTTGKRIITIKENTTNILKDGAKNYGEDYDEAVICSRRSSLTINGNGKLILEGVAINSSGIKVKQELRIFNSNIEINAKNNGIKADDLVYIKDANIKINADNDGIKTSKDPLSTSEANTFASDSKYGYLYIENTSLDITSGDDGLSANNTLYINNGDTNLIKIKTNNGTPSTINEISSATVNGKAIRVEGINLVDLGTLQETYFPATHDKNYSLVIAGGRFDINSNDDALHSKGNIFIHGGEFSITSGDDALHADNVFQLDEAEININKCFEGVEACAIEVYGGKLNVTSIDDGITANNSLITDYDFHFFMENGDVTINSKDDGLSSNGWIQISGGNLLIHGSETKSALDSEKGILINGGNIIALGVGGLVEVPAINSTQCYVCITTPTPQTSNNNITVADNEGSELINIKNLNKYQSALISLESLEEGKTYSFTIGNQNYKTTLEKINTALGCNFNGIGNQGSYKK